MRRVAAAVIGLGLLVGAAPAHAFHQDLAGHWSFDVVESNESDDASGHGNTANLFDATPIPDGRFGGAVDFTGNDASAARVGAPPSNDELEPNFVTVAAWVRRAGTPGAYRYVVGKRGEGCFAAAYALYSGDTANEGMRFYIYEGDVTIKSPPSGPGVWDGEWHAIAGVYGSDGMVRLFVDGVEVAPGTGDQDQFTPGIAYSLNSESTHDRQLRRRLCVPDQHRLPGSDRRRAHLPPRVERRRDQRDPRHAGRSRRRPSAR